MRLKRSNSNFMTILLVAIFIQLSAPSKLQLTDDGYFRNMLVVMEMSANGSIPELHYSQLLQALRTVFQSVSDMIGELTEPVGRRLSFSDVSVLVPNQLGRQLAKISSEMVQLHQATWERRDHADFHVSPDFYPADDGPVWEKPACGKPAKKIMLAAESLFNHTIARDLTLHFSQYRWGLHSEAPLAGPTYKILTPEGEARHRVSSCSPDIRTNLLIASGPGSGLPCDFSDTRQRNRCRVVVAEPFSSSAASFLFAPYSPGVFRFCDSDRHSSGPKRGHNKEADNLLNRYCGGRSAAEVIREHRDFQQISSAVSTKSKINFRLVVEPDKQRVVIAMDMSGSMGHESRFYNMIATVIHYLRFQLETGSECALIFFDIKANILHKLVKVDSAVIRERLVKSVMSLRPSGDTCIGAAALLAMAVLGEDPKSPTRNSVGQIVLFSDGEEICSGALDSAINALSKTSLKVDTIRFGDQADMRMSRLSEVTGGQQFFGPVTTSGLAALDLTLSLLATSSDTAWANETVALASQMVSLDFHRPLKFRIDASVRHDLVFWLFFPGESFLPGKLRLALRSPSGKEFNCSAGNSAVCTIESAARTATVKVPDESIETGHWTLANLAALPNNQTAAKFGQVLVTGRIGPRLRSGSVELPIKLYGSVEPDRVLRVKEDTEINVCARLIQGATKILNSQIYAVVKANNAEVARFSLFDVEHFRGSYCGQVPAYAITKARDYTIQLTCTSPVSRLITVGRLRVVAENPEFNRQRIPPNPITDLSIEQNYAEGLIRLHWRPVKDPSGLLKPGAYVPAYTVRYSTLSSAELRTNFLACPELIYTEETSVNIFSQYEALGKPLMFVAVAAVSASNVAGEIRFNRILSDPVAEPSLDELKKWGWSARTKRTKAQLRSAATSAVTVGVLAAGTALLVANFD
ncbi:hypothetical protein BOX15_Mlig028759g1 [Macrostomum lignano]|uniref:VWFA domain-containing protein n=2 Tax=Macrostomum lignano TaxID=282301 RepID=A0A1I8G2Q7_9PLAT|nr:hypothetical protein BOX15_Mlig028759g1 [Macrostomum lignano]